MSDEILPLPIQREEVDKKSDQVFDVAMRGIAALQRRIESIDRVLARVINRA